MAVNVPELGGGEWLSQNLSEGMRASLSPRTLTLRSLTSYITGVKCVRLHPCELQPRALAFKIEEHRGLACHVLLQRSPTVKQYAVAVTYEYDLFGNVHPGVYCLSVRHGPQRRCYTFSPNEDDLASYIRDEMLIDDHFNVVIKEGGAKTVYYYPGDVSIPVGKHILFYAHSDVEADLYNISLMMRLAYYQFPKPGLALEGQ
uniref:Uncharacterized protein n=1 Tax=viral metagenome TaxID=1070528 RepID=A0A2V0R9J6_9ZZZZ